MMPRWQTKKHKSLVTKKKRSQYCLAIYKIHRIYLIWTNMCSESLTWKTLHKQVKDSNLCIHRIKEFREYNSQPHMNYGIFLGTFYRYKITCVNSGFLSFKATLLWQLHNCCYVVALPLRGMNSIFINWRHLAVNVKGYILADLYIVQQYLETAQSWLKEKGLN